MKETKEIEAHPFQPFLPEGARILLLGSFPPQEKRWSMDFYYPNWINDFWRITGLIFFEDTAHFTVPGEKKFDINKVESFCMDKGFAMYDTAVKVRRLQDNASDKFLEIVEQTDIEAMLAKIPECTEIVATGQKAADVIASVFGCTQPPVGSSVQVFLPGRTLRFWRMPSTSRAYPLPLVRKAEIYRKLYSEAGLM